MATRTWAPGEYITPGDLRQPRTSAIVGTSPPTNADFEAGNTGWTEDNPGTWVIESSVDSFQGSWSALAAGPASGNLINDNHVPVVAGQAITAKAYVAKTSGNVAVALRIYWYDSGNVFISYTQGAQAPAGAFREVGVNGTAPSNAAFAAVAVSVTSTAPGANGRVDAFSWNYVAPVVAAGLVYQAVQANAGFTGSTEPLWPTTLGAQVVDNEVTWEAVLASSVTWEATPILLSGSTEPAFPDEVGETVLDNTIVWEAISRRIEDENCPNTKAVAIGASKVFAGDRDIIRFSATVNPLDWSSADDAGYLPFGLQTYGSNDVAALGLYRSNLVAFNSQGFQMWQIDQDPANMAFLDAVPVGCTYVHSIQPVANDLLMLTAVGVRNISIAGASTNLQADSVGEVIDPLVRTRIKLMESDDDALALFWPGTGQYWVIFEVDGGESADYAEVFVLTINGTKKKSWSRYTFPEPITDWTLDGNTLVLRTATGKVWEMDDETLQDDHYCAIDFVIQAGVTDSFPDQYSGYHNGQEVSFGSLVSPEYPYTAIGYSVMEALYDETTGEFWLSLTDVDDTGNPPAEAPFDSLSFTDSSDTLHTLVFADATSSLVTSEFGDSFPAVRRWVWTGVSGGFANGVQYTVSLFGGAGGGGGGNCVGIDIEGVIQWPYLDMGAIGLEKGLVGIDLVCEAPEGVSVSIGYNQNNRTQRTADYEVDPDTMTGQMVPFPVSGPSFDLKLTFAPGQAWEWQAANLYVQEWRRGA